MSSVPNFELGMETSVQPFSRRAVDIAENGQPHTRSLGGQQWYNIQAVYPLLSDAEAEVLMAHANDTFDTFQWTNQKDGIVYNAIYTATPPSPKYVEGHTTITLFMMGVRA